LRREGTEYSSRVERASLSAIAEQPVAAGREGWLERRRHALTVVGGPGFLLITPAVAIAVNLVAAVDAGTFAFDFNAYWLARVSFLEGESPYSPITAEALASHVAFVYPPLAAALFAPLALLPKLGAAVLFTVLLAGALIGALRILGVTDWRWYAAAFLWPSVAYAIQSANLTLLLVLGLAVAWRFRRRALVAGSAVGILLALKLFLWPLLICLVATRRYRVALASVATAALTTSAAWSRSPTFARTPKSSKSWSSSGRGMPTRHSPSRPERVSTRSWPTALATAWPPPP
jgi:hypothetical protein